MNKMNTCIQCKRIVSLILPLLLLLPLLSYGDMNDYCVDPPFIVAGVTPNLLLMIDNSASMYDLTYLSSSPDVDYCYDTSYDDTQSYEGYFDQDEYYVYNGAQGRFDPGAALPVGCDYRTDYACINITGTTVDDFIAKGKFLNWLSASKFDVQKKILTGGKYDTVNQVLTGESRGCVGRRFIKRIPAFADITFAIRGPNALEPDYTNPETQGGMTRIEIFHGTYNNEDCQEAIDIWQDDDPLGQWMGAASDCLGISGGAGTASGRELATFIESVRGCWHIKNNIEDIEAGIKALTVDNILKNVTINNLETHCTNVYTKDCPDPDDLSTCEPLLNNEAGGSYICAKTATHLAPPSPYYDILGSSDTSGFVGLCWSGAADKFVGGEDCIKREFLHYCSGYAGAEVVDPSSGASSTTADNLPAIIRDASVRALGDPLTPSGSADEFFSVKVGTATVPEGLIQEFSDLIRFGAMSFNYSGSPSECETANADIICPRRCSTTTDKICSGDSDCPAGETCQSLTNLDGGKVIHHIGYVDDTPDDSVGDHSSGLINTLDNLLAETWTPFAEGFYNAIGYFAKDTNTGNSRIDLRINPGDFDETKNPVQYRCQKNNILIVTDGMSTADLRNAVNTLVLMYNDGDGQTDDSVSATCPSYAGSRNLDDLAWLAKNRNIQDFTQLPTADSINGQTITTHVVFNGVPTGDPAECNPDLLMSETAANGGGTYARAEDPAALELALAQAFQEIAGGAASGTAASVLASGEGTGANLVQAIFYPERTYEGREILWAGSLKNLWYHIDPLLGNSTIREDSDTNKILTLKCLDNSGDRIIHFDFIDNETKAKLFKDSDGDGTVDDPNNPEKIVDFEVVKSLWEAGGRLWATNADDRKIYTTTDGTNRILFNTGNAGVLQALLDAGSVPAASQIISYIRGDDKFCSVTIDQACQDTPCPGGETCESLRSRMITHDFNFDGDTGDTVPETDPPVNESDLRVWKLGDIVNSTPRIVSWVPLNSYGKTYGDKTYEAFTGSTVYTDRGLVIVGANDGMLHAFKLGTLELFEERDKKAALSGADLGKEQWAFIPRSALPYLKYLTDEAYCHLYTVDLTAYVVDVSIGDGLAGYWNDPKDQDSWKTIVIGGMRIAGASNDACVTDINNDGNIDSGDCVRTPAQDIGYSSYFALDITKDPSVDENYPKVLWEFSNEEIADAGIDITDGGLGFATSGPAIVRIAAKTVAGIPDNTKNGRWFVVFGSGPTGPIDTLTHQFRGYSDQSLKLYVLDLANPAFLLKEINTGIPYAFAGSLMEAAIDFHQDNRSHESFYQDDALYFGYVKAEDDPPDYDDPEEDPTRWNTGGVLRLFTHNDINGNWTLSTVMDGIGPVTTGVKKLQKYDNPKKVFLFFGTGRYFYRIGDKVDDALTPQYIYGVKEPCFDTGAVPDDIDFGCSAGAGALENLDPEDPAGAGEDVPGWKIKLDDAVGDLMAERNVTDPLATPIGAVFFTTTKPSSDVCSFGGHSHLWAVDWDTGGQVKSSVLRGKALLQVSTGEIKEIDLKTAFEEKGGRRTVGVWGVPPSGTPPGILIPPKPTNKFIHIFEK